MVGWKRRSAALRRERGPAGRFMRCGALRSLRRLVSAGMPRGSPGEMKRVVRTRPVHQPGARQGQYGDPAKGVEGEFPARVACGCVTNPGLPSGSYPRFSRLFGRSSKRFANKTWRSGIFRGSRAAPFPGFPDYSDDRPNDLLTDLAEGDFPGFASGPFPRFFRLFGRSSKRFANRLGEGMAFVVDKLAEEHRNYRVAKT